MFRTPSIRPRRTGSQSLLHQGNAVGLSSPRPSTTSLRSRVSIPSSSGKRCRLTLHFARRADCRKMLSQSLLHQGNAVGQPRVIRLDVEVEVVSIPSSSGKRCRRRLPGRLFRPYPGRVSIPSSSGKRCREWDEHGSCRAAIIGSQSLLHQGNAVGCRKTRRRSCASSRVSIPSSSGKRCRIYNGRESSPTILPLCLNPFFIRETL